MQKSDGSQERENAQLADQQRASDRKQLERARDIMRAFLSATANDDHTVLKQAQDDARAFLRQAVTR